MASENRVLPISFLYLSNRWVNPKFHANRAVPTHCARKPRTLLFTRNLYLQPRVNSILVPLEVMISSFFFFQEFLTSFQQIKLSILVPETNLFFFGFIKLSPPFFQIKQRVSDANCSKKGFICFFFFVFV